jgi:hypothetical protein
MLSIPLAGKDAHNQADRGWGASLYFVSRGSGELSDREFAEIVRSILATPEPPAKGGVDQR